jgi:hypothetical protein
MRGIRCGRIGWVCRTSPILEVKIDGVMAYRGGFADILGAALNCGLQLRIVRTSFAHGDRESSMRFFGVGHDR